MEQATLMNKLLSAYDRNDTQEARAAAGQLLYTLPAPLRDTYAVVDKSDRGITSDQVAVQFHIATSSAYGRLQRLVEMGLVRRIQFRQPGGMLTYRYAPRISGLLEG